MELGAGNERDTSELVRMLGGEKLRIEDGGRSLNLWTSREFMPM